MKVQFEQALAHMRKGGVAMDCDGYEWRVHDREMQFKRKSDGMWNTSSVGYDELLSDWELVEQPATDEELVAELLKRANQARDESVSDKHSATMRARYDSMADAYSAAAYLIRQRKVLP